MLERKPLWVGNLTMKYYRYFAIMHPLQKSISWFKQHRTCIVVLVWSFGTAIGCSQLVVSETSTFEHSNQTYLSCGERWEPGSLYGKLYTLFIFSSTFALPMAILSVVYSAMGWRLLRYRVPGDHAKPHYDPLLNANATRRGLAQKSRPTVTTTPLPITGTLGRPSLIDMQSSTQILTIPFIPTGASFWGRTQLRAIPKEI